MHPVKTDSNYNSNQIILYIVMLLINITVLGLIVPFIVHMLKQQVSNLSFIAQRKIILDLGFVMTLFSAYILTAPIIGAWSDRVGRKPALMLEISFSILGYSIVWIGLQISSLTAILFGIFLVSINYLSWNLILASIADVSKKRSLCVNLILISIPANMIFLTIYMGYFLFIVQSINDDMVILFAFLLKCINFILVLFFYKETCPLEKRLKIKENPSLLNSFSNIFSSKKLTQSFIAYALFMLGWYIYFEYTFETSIRVIPNSIRLANFSFIVICLVLLTIILNFSSIRNILKITLSIAVIAIFMSCYFFQAEILYAHWIAVIVTCASASICIILLQYRLLSATHTLHLGLFAGLTSITSPFAAFLMIVTQFLKNQANNIAMVLPVCLSVLFVLCAGVLVIVQDRRSH